MSEIAITVENLGKQYRVGTQQREGRHRYKSLRDTLADAASVPIRLLRSHGNRRPRPKFNDENTFWALKDVSFEIKRGEVVGIIGRNGAGKSTLLKVLSRITEPTSGRIRIHGRVASLLEVGTGFHPELTGRENIFMNGAILGMTRAEIQRKFDEIVAFAEVDKFLDTPVKYYSSGMYVRLAFAVAAHLEQEILVIDEVLAVGDAEFQKKCLGKMHDAAKSGRTVFFVSHNMTAIESLCERCLLLGAGKLQEDGAPASLVRLYLARSIVAQQTEVDLRYHPNRAAFARRIMLRLRLIGPPELGGNVVPMRGQLGFEVEFKSSDGPIRPILGLVIKTAMGTHLCGFNNRFLSAPQIPSYAADGKITCWIKDIPFMPGTYFVNLYFDDGPVLLDTITDVLSFNIIPADVFGTGDIAPSITGPLSWAATFNFEDA